MDSQNHKIVTDHLFEIALLVESVKTEADRDALSERIYEAAKAENLQVRYPGISEDGQMAIGGTVSGILKSLAEEPFNPRSIADISQTLRDIASRPLQTW